MLVWSRKDELFFRSNFFIGGNIELNLRGRGGVTIKAIFEKKKIFERLIQRTVDRVKFFHGEILYDITSKDVALGYMCVQKI